MKRVARNAHTSKHLGCLGATTAGNPDATGAAFVRNVLAGFSYDAPRYDRELQAERQRDLCTRINQGQQDITALAEKLAEYAEMFDGVPQPVVDRVHELSMLLSTAALAVDAEYMQVIEDAQAQYDAECCDMRLHYGSEPGDYRGDSND